MGFVSGLLGGGGGAAGSGFSAPAGVDPAQLNTAYGQTQAGIQQQQDFVKALGTQGGLGNQSSVFQQQQGLANQLQGVANGTGPNPALAQLNQATAKNTANQAALMAGQRGASQNVGMIARNAAQQGGANQQNAVGQAATLQAQQQLGAMGQLQGQQANMGNMANTQVGQQQAGLNALNQSSLQQQANLLGMQQNMNTANAGLAQTTMGGQQNMAGGLMNGIGGGLGSMFGGSSPTGGGGVFGSGAVNIGGGGSGNLIADPNAADVGGMYDPSVFAEGGKVQKMADGGMSNPSGPQSSFGQVLNSSSPEAQVQAQDQPSTQVAPITVTNMGANNAPAPIAAPAAKSSGGGGNPLGGMGNMAGTAMKGLEKWGEHEALPYLEDFVGGLFTTAGGAGGAMAGGAADAAPAIGAGAVEGAGEVAPVMLAAKGGKVPALVSPGERYLSPEKVNKVAQGKADPIKDGKLVPGKPKVGGAKNSYANDTVKASLDEGGIVIPRSITQGKNPHWEAMKFVHKTMAKGGKIPKKGK